MVLLLILASLTAAIGVMVVLPYKTTRRASRVLDEVKEVVVSARLKVDGTLVEIGDLISSREDQGGYMSDLAADVEAKIEKARETTGDLADMIKDTTTRQENQTKRVDYLLTQAVG